MKSLLGMSAIALALTALPAAAADLRRPMPVKAPPPAPVVAAYNWSGFYIGAHGGGAWAEKCFGRDDDFLIFDNGDNCHKGDGWLAGGQIGFNWQSGQFVFGVEFSGSFLKVEGEHRRDFFDDVFFWGHHHHHEANSLFMLTGRVGLAMDRTLLYVTGGGASIHDHYKVHLFNDFDDFHFESKHRRWGWTIGAGVEWGFTPNFSVAFQYNYINFGDRDTDFHHVDFGTFRHNIEQDMHLATVRLNYRFGGKTPAGVVARY